MKQQVFDEYLKQIDLSRLKRNYFQEPLGKVSGKWELPNRADVDYLYMELNFPRNILTKIFIVDIFKGRMDLPEKSSQDKLLSLRTYQSLNAKYRTDEEKQTLIEKCRKTKLERYGDSRYNNIEKSKETKLKKYGNPTYNNMKKNKETKLKKYGDEKYNNIDKCIQTNLDKYGVPNPMQRKEIIDKAALTKQERYGDSKYNNREKFKQTSLARYGFESPRKNEAINNKIKKTCQKKFNANSPLESLAIQDKIKATFIAKYGCIYPGAISGINNKIKETCLEKYQAYPAARSSYIKEKTRVTLQNRYGVDSYTQTQEYKDLFRNKNFLEKKLEKEYQTKKLHNSFNTSTPESKIYNILLTKFPDTLTQYKSSVYPYSCDFYIPSLDVYIEYQGSWTHGYHSFDKNNPEDLKTLEKWKEKSLISKFYKNAIETWTIRDVKKRKIAKANNLNYLEFFNIQEFMNWLDKQ